MSGLLRFLVVALIGVGLSGCVTYPYSYYAPVDPYATNNGYYAGEAYGDGYAGYDDGYSYAEPLSEGYATGWPVYYSTLWPVYRNYYDPYWSPGFYYGVTWFPSTYFGLGIGGWDAWPYYTHYSPYRYSFWDSYYAWYDPWWYGGGYGYGHGHGHGHGDWDDDDHDGRGGRGGRGGRDPSHGDGEPRFGSARNEAERLARIDGLSGQGVQSRRYGAYGNAQGATGRNWRGTPPQGALSQAGAAGGAPLSNARLYDGSRFNGRPGVAPANVAQPRYNDNATAGSAPGAPAGGSRREIQRMGGAPGYATPAQRDAYQAPTARTPQPADRNSGWVGPGPRSRPTGRYDERQYNPNAAGSSQPPPRSYARPTPSGDYAPIQGSAGGSSRWRSAPANSPAAPAAESWNRSSGGQRGNSAYNGANPDRGRQSMPQADYAAPRADSPARFESRQQRYEAPQQSYQAPQRREAPAPRYDAPQRQESRDDSNDSGGSSGGGGNSGGGGRSESSRFERGGRDRED